MKEVFKQIFYKEKDKKNIDKNSKQTIDKYLPIYKSDWSTLV